MTKQELIQIYSRIQQLLDGADDTPKEKIICILCAARKINDSRESITRDFSIHGQNWEEKAKYRKLRATFFSLMASIDIESTELEKLFDHDSETPSEKEKAQEEMRGMLQRIRKCVSSQDLLAWLT